MVRISSPIEDIKDHYDVVVIGSGYGGGIAASRISRAGKKVCLLERGREIRPGEYPDTEVEAISEMQVDAAAGHVGSKTGMFNFHVNEEQNVLVGCGLGGTSLINANVSLEPEPEVFDDPRWPKAVREHRDTLLQDGFARAREMLKPNPYPDNAPTLPKMEAHRKSAEFMKEKFYKTPINVTFEDPKDGVNHVGVEQKACNFCGDCVSGCNNHAKNTTLMNYLPDAWNHGAEIFCEASVRYLEKTDDGWHVHYQIMKKGREKFDAPTLFVKADVVVLSAGTLGSTEIMLRSREKGLNTSDQLGLNFSGNGDILGFGYNNDQTINGVGFGNHPEGEIPPVGPCITSIIDMRKGDDWPKRMIIEEGAIPGAVGKLLPGVMSATAKLVGKDTDHGIMDAVKEKTRELDSLVRGPYHGAIKNMQTYLIMSHDDGAGKIELKNDRACISWPGVGEQENFVVGNKKLYQATKALGGEYVKNPIWTDIMKHSIVSVHPLGGCVMGEDAGQGVVNHKGQVFSGNNGQDVYENLYVTDGAVIPTSLAINPLLTISAVSERCCTLMAEEKGWNINYSLPSKPTRKPAEQKLGVRFTETMKGYFSTNFEAGSEISVFKDAEKMGKAANSEMEFTLTVISDDLNELVDSPSHNAEMVGTLNASALSAQPMTATEGVFNLFVVYPEKPGTRHMNYNMKLSTEEGKTFWFSAFKEVHDDPDMFEIWPDTSTLYVTVTENDPKGKVVGKGVLHIKPADFAKQMTTMAVTGAKDNKERLEGLARFGGYFAGSLWETYGGVFAKPTVFNPDAPPRKKRPLRVDAPTVHDFKTEDGVRLRLTRYQGGTKGPVILVHGLGVSSAIFSTDTIKTNMLEYLFAHGYDVWLLDFRVSIALPASENQSTGDDVAKYDFPAATAKVKEITGSKTVQYMVHCYGASTFFMSMLGGLKDVRSIVCSQIAANVYPSLSNKIKTGVHLPEFLEKLGIDSLTAYVDKNENWVGKLLDKANSVYALSQAQGFCNNPVCHRITFLYSSLHRHVTLNDTLHNNLHELFGVANISSFEHLALMMRKGTVVSAKGEDIYMPHFDRLNLPICFIHGEKNDCYLPKSTKTTYNILCEKFGEEQYSRHVISGYGHIDCIYGRDAVTDVYPHVLAHLEKTATE